MKSRMTALDVRAAVAQLRPLLLGLRLANIYDVNFSRRIYLLKFAKGEEKHHILIESGIRIHTTLYQRDKNAVPSSFAMKLRKHLRTRRLEGLQQLGADRVIDFVFGVGQNATHLLIEFYVSGNIVLTDANYTILSVLRAHSNVESGRVAVGKLYPVPPPDISFCLCPGLVVAAQRFLPEGDACTAECLSKSAEKVPELFTEMEALLRRRLTELQNREDAKRQQSEQQQQQQKKKGDKKAEKRQQFDKKGKVMSLSMRDALAAMLPFAHPALLSHALAKIAENCESLDITTSSKIDNKTVDIDDVESHKAEHFSFLVASAMECFRVLVSVSTSDDYLGLLNQASASLFKSISSSKSGWAIIDEIIHLPATTTDPSQPNNESSSQQLPLTSQTAEDSMLPKTEIEVYGDFTPALFLSHQSLPPQQIRKFDGFLQCIDTFFSNLELVKQSKQDKQTNEQTLTKSEKIKLDQQRRVDQLVDEQRKAEQYAKLIEANLTLVQQSITMLQASLSTGVAWSELWNHIKLEKRNNHPIACTIHSLDLQHQRAYLLLELIEYDSLEEDHEVVPVPVDLDISAYGNVERLHSGRKQMKHKVERTEIATKVALDKALKKGSHKKVPQKSSQQQSGGITRIRKHFWFEKFNWFISSENYLVLAGRDAQQNDMLFKRYFEKNDIYVHADVHGAASCIIKNPTNEPVPPVTLLEAGRMSVCRSSAWDSKLVTSAWWVYRSQVSKTAPTGEYLVSGAFIIRGKKNFLPPWKLEMGLGILFQLGEDSISVHQGERKRRGSNNNENDEEKRIEKVDENETVEVSKDDRLQDAYGVVFPSEALRLNVEAELASEDVRYELEEAAKQLRRLEKKQKGKEVKEKEEIKGKKDGGTKVMDDKGVKEVVQVKEQQSSEKQQVPRGKRSKLKRLKQKYQEQEPEERALRMALLGAKNMKNWEIPTAEIRSKKVEVIGKEDVDESSSSSSSESSSDGEKEEEEEEMKELENVEEEEPLVVEEMKDELIEENDEGRDDDKVEGEDEQDDEVMIKKLSELDCLTSIPRNDDTLISAVPVCAPWSTLQGYKYKIKLLPGGMKKGKAGQQCVKLMSQQATSPAERELIRMIDMNDLGNALVGNLKVSMPGLQDLQKAEKAAKKQQKAAMRQIGPDNDDE